MLSGQGRKRFVRLPVLPVGQIRFGHTLAGGVTATVLWEVTRHVMVWYFAQLSMVNVIYGAMAATIVVLSRWRPPRSSCSSAAR